MRYVNYHSHSQYSNIITPDVNISNRDRANRAKELEHVATGFIEHGYTGRFVEGIELGKEFGLKPILGSEVYFVKNRLEKDNTNSHLIFLAKNETGRKAINRIISEANQTGFYYKARVDYDLVFSLPSDSVWVTTACIGGIWKYEDYENIVLDLKGYFGGNFCLEVQNHLTESQQGLNRLIIELSNRHNIPIIAGMDSHMIYPEQSRERDNYLLSRGIEYPDEQGWFLDFPTYDEVVKRFERQGILNKYQIQESLDNTLILEEVEEYDSIIFNKGIVKLPSLYPDNSQEEKNNLLSNLVEEMWNIEKANIPKDKISLYKKEIKRELDVVFSTNIADYFLLDYEIIKRGKEKGGSITFTGRGSAPSFYLSKLLGFTTIDRISASVKLFPERFISAERLNETKSLPDIDFNLGTPEIFAEAQSEIMGFEHSFQMIAFGTVKTLGAWKIYARVTGVDFETANRISEQIQKYEQDYKHAETEEEKDELDVYQYIDEQFHEIYDESKKYLGLVNSVTPHPCAYLIFSHGDIREEFGLIKIKTGNVEHICANCDGLFAEEYKLLKNDLLKVSVVDLIHKVYDRIGIEPHTLPELIELCENNEKVWQIYANAWTMGINQVEQTGSSGRVAKYKPQNISEISAFVAAIRPGFKSNYSSFEKREPFSYGIPSLDNLIQTREFPQSYMLYQEHAMQVMAYAGIPVSQTYEIIKNIAKKRAEKVFKYKETFIKGMTKKIMESENRNREESESIAHRTWQIIEDSSRYSFNASHSYSVAGDSLYGAYLKSHYPLYFYETFLRILEEDGDKDRLAATVVEAEKAFKIRFPRFEFGQDNRSIVANLETNEITSSLKTIKGFGSQIGDDLYQLSKDYHGNNFLELLIVAEEKGVLSSKWQKLIHIGYFKKFGKNKKLDSFYHEFKSGEFRYNKKLTEKSKIKRIAELEKIWTSIPDENFPIYTQVSYDNEILGFIQTTFENINSRYVYVMSLDTRYAPRFQAYCLKNGKQQSIKVQKKIYDNDVFNGGDILYCKKFIQKNPVKYIDGKYVEDEDGEKVWWLDDYDVVDYKKFNEIV